jgi:hypothetical protein
MQEYIYVIRLYFIVQQKPLRIYHYPYFRTPFSYTWCGHVTVNSRPPDLPSTACNHLCRCCLQIVLPPAHHSSFPFRLVSPKKLSLSTLDGYDALGSASASHAAAAAALLPCVRSPSQQPRHLSVPHPPVPLSIRFAWSSISFGGWRLTRVDPLLCLGIPRHTQYF